METEHDQNAETYQLGRCWPPVLASSVEALPGLNNRRPGDDLCQIYHGIGLDGGHAFWVGTCDGPRAYGQNDSLYVTCCLMGLEDGITANNCYSGANMLRRAVHQILSRHVGSPAEAIVRNDMIWYQMVATVVEQEAVIIAKMEKLTRADWLEEARKTLAEESPDFRRLGDLPGGLCETDIPVKWVGEAAQWKASGVTAEAIADEVGKYLFPADSPREACYIAWSYLNAASWIAEQARRLDAERNVSPVRLGAREEA